MKISIDRRAMYFVLDFIYDFNGKTFEYFPIQNSEDLEKFKEFKTFVENETRCITTTLAYKLV